MTVSLPSVVSFGTSFRLQMAMRQLQLNERTNSQVASTEPTLKSKGVEL